MPSPHLSLCLSLCAPYSYQPPPLSASMRSFEFDMVFGSSSLKQCNTEILLPEIAPCLLTPFFWSAAVLALDRCTVVLMLWHFHKEMDVVGSIRQHSDIYIRKNGCCWAREERKVGEEERHSGYHPILTDAP